MKTRHLPIQIDGAVFFKSKEMQTSRIFSRGLKTWGKLGIKQVGFYEYGTSPFHLKPFKGFFNPGLFKLATRWATHAPYILPPMVFFYWLSIWADKKVYIYLIGSLNTTIGRSGLNQMKQRTRNIRHAHLINWIDF
jgi:hypothetical protein